jgi:hypothetical protein
MFKKILIQGRTALYFCYQKKKITAIAGFSIVVIKFLFYDFKKCGIIGYVVTQPHRISLPAYPLCPACQGSLYK